jgi:PAS domain S-box-containing protein
MSSDGRTYEQLQAEVAQLRETLEERNDEVAALRQTLHAATGEDRADELTNVPGRVQEVEGRFRALADAAPVFIWMADERGATTYLNERWRTFTGRSFEKEQAWGWLESVHPQDRTMVRHAYKKAFGNRSSFRLEYRLRERSGTYHWLLDSGVPRFLPSGEFIGYIGSRVDITERKESELQLREAKDEAEALARLKSAFLTNMTHEVRTPLTVIMGFTSMLRQGVKEEYERFVQVIERSGRRLMRMLDSLLDLAQLEAGTMQTAQNPTLVADLVRSVAESMRPLAEDKGLAFHVATPQPHLHADLDYAVLARVLTNLIDNAIKFTDSGEIVLAVEGDDEHVYLRVKDTGIGIDETFFPHMFTAFSQESTGLTRTHQGTGLGLAVSKRLVELMGGSIHVESYKGAGSVFTICLSRSASTPVHVKAAS